jgi:hypothetical protein
MATTRNIMSSALFSLPYLGYQPVNVSNQEPALNAANLTKQVMLGPPFAWPWNRNSFAVDMPVSKTTNPAQDYDVLLTDYGFIEKAWVVDAKGKSTEIKVVLVLAAESTVQRPASVAAQTLNDDGTVTFRTNAIPDQTYTLVGCYQKASIQISSLASSWSPIPDALSYIYDLGFLFFVSWLTKDARSQAFGQKFASALLGAQSGLTATQRNIFLGNFLAIMTEPQRAQAETQQGVAARQV